MSERAGEIAELRQDIRTERERIDAIKKELFDRMLEFAEKTNNAKPRIVPKTSIR